MDLGEVALILQSLDKSELSPENFANAAQQAQRISSELEDEQQLLLYGLFKQSTVGVINTEPPIDKYSVEYYKWSSWKQMEGFAKDEAMLLYIFFVLQFQEVATVTKSSGMSGVGSYVSTLIKDYSKDVTNATWSKDEEIHKAVFEGDKDALIKYLEDGGSVDLQDDQGRSFLHYAADSGHVELVKVLLARGAMINIQDNELQTALMLAVLCEHKEIVELLLANNADITLKNNEDETVLDMFDCQSSCLSEFFAR